MIYNWSALRFSLAYAIVVEQASPEKDENLMTMKITTKRIVA